MWSPGSISLKYGLWRVFSRLRAVLVSRLRVADLTRQGDLLFQTGSDTRSNIQGWMAIDEHTRNIEGFQGLLVIEAWLYERP